MESEEIGGKRRRRKLKWMVLKDMTKGREREIVRWWWDDVNPRAPPKLDLAVNITTASVGFAGQNVLVSLCLAESLIIHVLHHGPLLARQSLLTYVTAFCGYLIFDWKKQSRLHIVD